MHRYFSVCIKQTKSHILSVFKWTSISLFVIALSSGNFSAIRILSALILSISISILFTTLFIASFWTLRVYIEARAASMSFLEFLRSTQYEKIVFDDP